MRKINLILVLGILITSAIVLKSEENKVYLDPEQPLEKRVKDLINRMTLEEKVAQMWCLPVGYPLDSLMEGKGTEEYSYNDVENGVGQIARISNNKERMFGPKKHAEYHNKVQKFFIENSRLNIPVIMHEEALHGFMAKDATNYPSALAMAGTFNTRLVNKAFNQIATEARSRGTHHTLTPVLDVARDPRWGRVEETYGEDPYLVSKMSIASISGLQGGRSIDKIDEDHVAATMKHFAAHGAPEGGHNIAPAQTDMESLWNIHLSPFKKAIDKSDPMSVMAAYHEWNGIPIHASDYILNDILRDKWNYDGVVVSDWFAIEELKTIHNAVPTIDQAGIKALKSGVDIELPNITGFENLVELVEEEKISEKYIDRAVKRLLRMKFKLGLFEDPYADPDKAQELAGSEEHRETSLEMANKSITLLKNEDKVLPIEEDEYETIAVIGPNADFVNIGNYAREPKSKVTPLEAIRNKVDDDVNVLYSQGVKLMKDPDKDGNNIKQADQANNENRIKNAIQVAERSDIVILALGANQYIQREGYADNHSGDNAFIKMRGSQNKLINKISKTGKPIVGLLFSGGPVAINNLNEKASSILECWYLGQETGTAVANALFGEINPGASLPISIPRNSGQLPVFYNHKPSSKVRSYIFDKNDALYPFGFGLSYTTFEVRNIKLNKKKISSDETARITATIENTGDREGEEVVQLYIRDKVSLPVRPIKELKGFQRISLDAGDQIAVTFEIDAEQLGYYNEKGEFTLESGEFEIMVGKSSRDQDLKSATLTLTE